MNTLEKFFKTIKSAPSARLKKYTTNELIRQLSEFGENALYIVKNIHGLLCSEDGFSRKAGAEILGALDVFDYTGEFELRTTVSNQVYLQCREIMEGPAIASAKQKNTLVKRLKLDHVDARFLDTLLDGEGMQKKELQNAKEVEEKEITTVNDFFEAMNRNMFSSDWYKRHGALLGYIAIFSNNKVSKPIKKTCDAFANRVVIELNSNIFCKVYEILLNDKFNDFQDDRTAAPVREAAAELLKQLFSYLNEDGVTGLFVEFLKNEDWQVQFSGMLVLLALREDLVASQKRVDYVLSNLVPFLNSGDEDIKYMAAELVDFIVVRTRMDDKIVRDVFERCWSEVAGCSEIGHAKASLLLLLKDICRDYGVKALESCNPLHGCFTSPIELVRRSAIELCEVLHEEELLYLLGECILLDKTSNGKEDDCATRAISILRDSIDNSLSAGKDASLATAINSDGSKNNGGTETAASCVHAYNLDDFTKHFLRIIGRNLHQPYDKNEFVCFEEAFFTLDGIRTLGCNRVLDNRLRLFEVLLRVPSVSVIEEKTMLAQSFNCIINYVSGSKKDGGTIDNDKSGAANNLEKISNDSNGDSKNSFVKNRPADDASTIPAFSSLSLEQLILNSIDDDFKQIQALRKMPKGEFIKMVYDPSYSSPYPMCDAYAVEYFRLVFLRNIYTVTDAVFYFRMEHNNAFLVILTRLLFARGIGDHMLISCYNFLVGAMDDLKTCTEATEASTTMNKKNKGNKHTSMLANPVTAAKEILNRRTYRNLVEVFGIVSDCLEKIGSFIMADNRRMLFFEATFPHLSNNAKSDSTSMDDSTTNKHVAHILTTQEILDEVFETALTEKNTAVLKNYITNMRYNERFVRRMLADFDVRLFCSLVEHSHPVFHSLFVKKTIAAFSDPDAGIAAKRLLASLVPALYFSTSEDVSDDLRVLIEAERRDAQMIVSPAEIPDYDISCPMTVSLRSYQKEGVKWMAFLARFGLNGILADDMGLGKTVQVLSFIISELHKRKNGQNVPMDNTTKDNALIICPSSLTTHWKDEAAKYFCETATVYNPKKQELFPSITIATYDNLRKDTNTLSGPWMFVVFDEGHLLKNRFTLLYSKAQGVVADHKFILTGTPIHNSVDDMFSLFNLIIPGYLGSESEFSATYGLKVTDKNVDVMEARLARLSKKVLPFVMRRLKTEVLKDLPPKIIKDVLIDLSSAHAQVYTNVERNEPSNTNIGTPTMKEQATLLEDVEEENRHINREHVETMKQKKSFEAKANNKQKLVGYAALSSSPLGSTRNLLKAASHPQHFSPSIPSSKTAALQDIFSISGEKKILVFFQNRQTIDFVISELGIANYLRLDGSVPPAQRGQIVASFISDSVQYLFLTTAVGGLGLNLVVAGVVVFYEHDWNPFNDLQAMDRAHRLGQRSTVNVFRLIARGTIEEKVMNYQNFKLHIASSVVTQQNTSVEKMDTKDLFERLEG